MYLGRVYCRGHLLVSFQALRFASFKPHPVLSFTNTNQLPQTTYNDGEALQQQFVSRIYIRP